MSSEKVVKVSLVFYISSVLGFLYELIISLVKNGRYHQGILFGPWLPIYGTGASLIFLLLKKYKKKPHIIFILSFFLTGFLELILGFIIHKFLHMRLWDYTGYFLNFKGYVCLLSAFIFGAGGLLTIYILEPIINKIYNKINKKILKIVLIIISVFFSIDIIATILK